MSEQRRSILPTLILSTMVVVIVGWFALLVLSTPEGPPEAVVNKLSLEVVQEVAVAHTLSPRVRVDGKTDQWIVGSGTVVAGFDTKDPIPYEDFGGTLSFSLPSAQLLDVDGKVLHLENDAGEQLNLPANLDPLEGQMDIALRHEAVVAGVMRQAETQLLRHLRSRFKPLGYFVEAAPGN